MLDTHSATARLARQMKSTEIAVANALIEALGLMQTAAMAQRDIAAPVAKTQATMQRMSKMIEGLVLAQADTLRVHGQLRDVSKEMAGPPEPECPDPAIFTTGEVLTAA